MGIGTKLSELIEANGTNPNELAKKIGVAPTTIYSIEELNFFLPNILSPKK